MTDVETGETFSSGSIGVNSAIKRVFNQKEGLFKANSIPNSESVSEWLFRRRIVHQCLYEVVELTNGDMSVLKTPVRTFEGEIDCSERRISHKDF